MIICTGIAAVIFFLGSLGLESKPSSVQTRPAVEAPRRAEQPTSTSVTRSDQGIRRGTQDVVVSTLHRNPDSRYPYRIHDGTRFVPVELRDGERLVGQRLRIWREFTGKGREFRITRYEIIR